MSPLALAGVVYSGQVLLVIGVAAVAETFLRGSSATARLAYWRAVGVLCLALPWIASSSRELPAVSAAFEVMPVGRVIPVGAASQVLPAIDVATPFVWIVWAIGAGIGLVWLLAGALRIRHLRRRSVPATVGADIDALRTDLAPRAEFRWSADLQQPVTLGIRRPLVLLPRRFDELSNTAKRGVACHELLHVKRRDWLWTVIEAHVRAVCWFHPGVWWMVDRLQLLREQVVDELVVERTSSRRDYMNALMAFADSTPSMGLSSAFVRRRHLKSRIHELLKESRMSFSRVALTMTALALVIGGFTVATVRALPLDLNVMAQQVGAASRLEIRLAETEPGPGLEEATVSRSEQRIYLHATTLATWSDVTLAQVLDPGNPSATVAVTLNSAAAARMASATAGHVGRPLAIILDGKVIAAPTVRDAIAGSAMLTGLTPALARELIDANLACHTNPAQCAAAVLPVPVFQQRPQYTQAAMAARIEGNVLLEVIVLADGRTGDVTVVKSLDSGLDQQAVDALKRWTWKPGTRGGEPARVPVQISMNFTLQ